MSWKTLVKILLSVVIVWLVLRNIDEQLLLATLRQVHPGWLLWTAAWFVFSKIVSAVRFNALLATEGIQLSQARNLRLYWLGMYYNLLLPGGISGDGYKIKLLMDAFGAPFKRLFAVTLLDRVGGVLALGQLCLLLTFGSVVLQPYWWIGLLGLAASVPFSLFVYKKLGGALSSVWGRTSLLSLLVQAAQLVATLGLVWALGESALWLEYSILFLVSSVVAMLPLTIGGTGARELTFLWGAAFLNIDAEKAVAIAFLFYLISTAIAFVGVVFSFNAKA
ncbi:MAG: flippase-like domain-containing protein [Saprospiraceae bacterium]|nr:flippase-like domain-containing protein [Saprospiraceae bacterium]